LIEALSQLDALQAKSLNLRAASGLRPSTQVALPGCGWLDLVIEILDRNRQVTGEIWVEVKISARESGSQLNCYQQRARARNPPAWLLTLAHHPLRATVPNLSWNELYHAARHGRGDHRSWKEHERWRDFGTFLEEQNVANDALGPISDREAASLEPAYELIQKVAAVVTAVHKKLPSLFPDLVAAHKLVWSNEGTLLNFVGAYLRSSGDMVGAGGPLRYGLTAQGGTAYWKVEVDGRDSARESLELARTKADQTVPPFGPPWDRPQGGSTILLTQTRATTLATHEAALLWFEERLREIAASGVVETLFRGVPTATGDTPAALPGLNQTTIGK